MRYTTYTTTAALALGSTAAYSPDSWTFGYGFYMGPPCLLSIVEIRREVGCSAGAEEWCVAATGQVAQPYVPVAKGAPVDFEITVQPTQNQNQNQNQNLVHQSVRVDGILVSQQTDPLSNPLQYLYSADECYTGSGTCGSLPGYSWINITIVLSEADPQFGQTLSLVGSTSSPRGLLTADGGSTWHAEAVVIPVDDLTAKH
ncbi:hypothetical protein ASPACDRAFT_1889059 [Aspergillus aculeatus ATCC 16872]|uniref:Uncharacterized protein n=1 Tax=Aspergillus aculeatus (strain ATCC 16872 / CBS 172.66 / WB 5094) TaxID=690307 RepID=A0A1L9WTP6_ASPA1|nr:uncharacterized protein ASPACDRAFT_1889059 [Aspergillus aculeatus ATCC 16872]OJJ99498.1 hypothetical protein ASPACDRAFT_1889059 [Aspergillus aculeatus ATCC 16872]